MQGFPENWKFSGAVYQILGQIGNSVAPVVGYQVGRAVAEALSGSLEASKQATCAGRAKVAEDWDVDTVRVDCEGCTECLTAKCDLCSTPTKPGESICWDCAESVARDA